MCSRNKESFAISFEDFLEILIVSLLFGIIGARLYYVIFRLDYYSSLTQVFNISDGGLAVYGGIIFGSGAAYFVCQKKKINVINFFDYICPYLAFTQAIGRIGNFFNVEAYGIETKNFFRMGIYNNTKYIEVHPCFLYEFVICMVLFIILKIVQKNRNFKGQVLSLYLIIYGLARFFIEGIRIDSLMFFNFRISQIISIIFIIIGLYVYKHNKLSSKNK